MSKSPKAGTAEFYHERHEESLALQTASLLISFACFW
jgi:hypothetical protein